MAGDDVAAIILFSPPRRLSSILKSAPAAFSPRDSGPKAAFLSFALFPKDVFD